jgi:hypothetical protein
MTPDTGHEKRHAHLEAVPQLAVPALFRRTSPPGRRFAGFRVGLANCGDHPARRRIVGQRVGRHRGSAAADDHVYGSLGGVDHVTGGRRGNRGQRLVLLRAADRVRTLVW